MNKRGKTSPALIAIGIGLILVIAFGVYSMSVTTDDDTSPTNCADSTGVLTINAVSKLEGASDPSSPTITCGVNGGQVKTSVTSGTTTFAVGDDLSCLVSKSDFIDTSFDAVMTCGGLNEQVEMYYATSDNPSIVVKDPNSADATVSDAIGGDTTNLTAPSVGGTVEFDVQFKGTNSEGTGNMIYVIELPASTSGNVTDITMGGLSKVAIPQVHALQNAGSKAVAFEVPNIEGAIKQTYSVIVTLGTGDDLAGGVYTDLYAGQDYIDDDGYIRSGVEDSDGTAKYENTLDYDFYVDA